MAQDFLLPDPGEGIHEADILEIHVSPGDEVKDGDPLFSVETDKAVVDVPSSFEGRIEEVRVDVGDVVPVGSVLLTFTTAGDSQPQDDTEEADEADEADEAEADSDEEVEADDAGADAETDDAEADEADKADEAEADADEDDDAGADAETDDAEADEDEADEAEADAEADDAEAGAEAARQPPVPASPATRSLAKKLGVDLHEIDGSGPEGRIEPGDVQAAAEGEGDEQEEEAESAPEESDEDLEWVELRGVRRASARQMARAWSEIPHVTHHDVADITELESLRREHASTIEEEGGKLSLTAFLVKAAAIALVEHPRFNASIDMENERVAMRSQINIGVAVDTDDGLVVPVVSDVPHKSIAEIAVELPELARRMRSGKRSLEDMEGGTFTVTNPGGIGGTSFEPIINHPEVAILGAAGARVTPVFDDDGEDLEARLHLPLVLAFDHRVNDGADAARFMNTVKALLEDPSSLLLRV